MLQRTNVHQKSLRKIYKNHGEGKRILRKLVIQSSVVRRNARKTKTHNRQRLLLQQPTLLCRTINRRKSSLLLPSQQRRFLILISIYFTTKMNLSKKLETNYHLYLYFSSVWWIWWIFSRRRQKFLLMKLRIMNQIRRRFFMINSQHKNSLRKSLNSRLHLLH